MQSLRGSLSSIPSAVVNSIIANIPSGLSGSYGNNTSNDIDFQSSHSSVSGDDLSEKSQAIPNCLITEQWQLILGQDASIDELTNAIARCKELVVNAEECSSERKWLVRHLVELRFRLTEMQDMAENSECNKSNTMIILGHHFQARTLRHPTTRQYCDHCSGIIWSVVQASYICADCQFCVHHKCVQNVIRICAHVIGTERKYPIEDICPEIGIAMQSYKCAECQTSFSFTNPRRFSCFGRQLKAEGPWIEPRFCDYTGLYYCPTCHWNDRSIIPARIIHNWDFIERKVCRASMQEMNIIFEWPVINLEHRNPKLFVYIQNLSLIQKLRENVECMRKYLSECRLAIAAKLLDQIGNKRHLIQSPLMYSISDLVAVENGNLIDCLTKLCQNFDKHIRCCDVCTGKGYICEICSNKEVMFPYDDGSIRCEKCLTVLHRACWLRKNMKCPKCLRLKERLMTVNEQDILDNIDNVDVVDNT